MIDVAIVGAGPVGLACAIEAKKHGLSYVVLEKSLLTNSVYCFPQNMTFYSTPELLEIGDIPFIISGEKPKRVDALKYYWRVTQHYQLDVKLDTKVETINNIDGEFSLQTSSGVYQSKAVIIATGFYDNPNYLGVPGEYLPHVSHYYSDPHKYVKKKVAIIGANNSAVEAGLELYRYNVEVTLIHRGSELSRGVKKWVVPDIQNRIKRNEIKGIFNATVQEIKSKSIVVNSNDKTEEIPADAVLALIGYQPHFDFMRNMGININDQTLVPDFDPDTGETNVEDIYIAGAIQAGANANKIFIENGRLHAPVIINAIKNKLIVEQK